MKGNMGFGVRPDGSAIEPSYNFMADDPRLHGLYLDKSALRFLRGFSSLSEKYDDASSLMLDANMYDGLGTLLPLGAYWYDAMQDKSFNFWTMGFAFDVFSVEELLNPSASLEAYKRLLQLHRFADSMSAFQDYVRDRQLKKYVVKNVLPTHMYWVRGGEVSKTYEPKNRPKEPDFDFKDEDDEPRIRYWYHAESDCLVVSQPEDDLESLYRDCDEIEYENYCSIKARIEKQGGDDVFGEDDEFDLL